jgi:hypothetical protein
MTRLGAVLLLAIVSGCSIDKTSITPAGELVFLTRDGCVNTATMRVRVDEALLLMGLTADYTVLNVATLPDDDARRGYPTPTLLYAKRDIFGLAAPRPSDSAPT